MEAFLLLVVGGLISLLIAVLLTDAFEGALVRVFGPLAVRRGRDISGQWFTYYMVVEEDASSSSAGSAVQKVEEIKLYKVGKHVVGRNETNSRYYRIRGTVAAEKFLTGIWEDFSEGRNHWGGFQLCWSDNGRAMSGKFLGKDSANHINHGLWLWCRTREELPELAKWMRQRGGYNFDIAPLLGALSTTTDAPSLASPATIDITDDAAPDGQDAAGTENKIEQPPSTKQ